MNIVVCVKLIPDPEAPLGHYRLAEAGRRMETVRGVNPVVSPFDENAIEAALVLREAHGGNVTALTVGPTASQEALKRALRMGADNAVQLDGEGVDEPSPQAAAFLLAEGIKKLGGVDLVLCGRQAGDWDQGQVGGYIAESLDIPAVSFVKQIEVTGGGLRVKRLTEDGYEVLELPLPALLTVTNEINLPRLTNAAAVLRAMKVKIPVWTKEDLGVSSEMLDSLTKRFFMERLTIPQVSTDCRMMPGETPADQATHLVEILREQKII